MSLPFVLLVLVFAFTGGTALLAEQAFEKLLSTVVGASTPASAIVLAVYFTGLSIGGLAYGARRRHPLAIYAMLEAAVAAACLGLDLGFEHLSSPFVPLLGAASGSPLALAAARTLVACAWVLPITIPMGATLPAVVDAAGRLPTGRVNATSVLYAANLVGALAGAVLGPSVVFPSVGLDGALRGVACVDGFAALTAFALLRRPQRAAPAAHGDVAVAGPAANAPRGLLALALLSGALFFGCEVLWTHLIGAVLGSSVYAFAAMLASVLLSLGIGSVLVAALFARRAALPSWAPGAALVVGGLAMLASAGAWPSVPHRLAAEAWASRSFFEAESHRWSMAVRQIVPAAVPLGMVYPLLFRSPLLSGNERGRATGQLVAANALGSVLGALATAFVLLPRAGSEVGLSLLAGASLAFGAVALAAFGATRAVVAGAVVAAAAAVWFRPHWDRLALTSGEHVYFRRGHVWPESRLLFFREDGFGGITTVVEAGGHRTLLSNGKFQGNDSGEMDAQTGFVLVPMQFVSNADRALVIGLGTGRSSYTVSALGFQSVDIAEVSSGIVDAARTEFAHVNGHVLDRPSVRLLLEDGRNVLLVRPGAYDLITMEISSIWFAGATNLYSVDFYRLARAHLREGGVFQQWVQFHHIGADDLRSIICSLRSVFPFVSLYSVGGQGILVATSEAQVVRHEFLPRLEGARSSLLPASSTVPSELRRLVSSRLLAPADVDAPALCSGVPLNTDRTRRLEYTTPRYNHRMGDASRGNIRTLTAHATFGLPACEPEVRDAAPGACDVSPDDFRRAHDLK